jgi:prophage tail gpP-like protein
MREEVTIIAGGQRFTGWTIADFGREIDRCASSFEITASDRWASAVPPLLPFTPLQLLIGSDIALTGYVDAYAPSFVRSGATTSITGRSKTAQLCDVTPRIPSGQYANSTVAAICTGIAQLCGITVVVENDNANMVLPNVTFQPCETAFDLMDRICAQVGVLLTDDEQGRLLLTSAGSTLSGTSLVEGQNMVSASATISGNVRFSEYIVLAQANLAVSGSEVQNAQIASVTDSSVPLFRPKVFTSDGMTTQSPLQTQAQWQMNYAIGQSAKADITVKGYRKNDGALWTINQIQPVTSATLSLDSDLLIMGVKYNESREDGQTTTLTLAPVQAADPNPKAVKLRKKANRNGKTISNWDGAGGF